MRTRRLMAWILIMVLMPLMMVKAFHYHPVHTHQDADTVACAHTHDGSHSHDGHSHDSDGGCFICHFALSPCVEAHQYQFLILLPSTYRQMVEADAQSSSCAVYAHSLRAPPYYYC